MPTRPPPPRPIRPDASLACIALHKVAQIVYENSPVFRCEVNNKCDSGLTCTLNVVFTEYKVNIWVSERTVMLVILSENGKTRYGQYENENVTIGLPEPRGTFLEFVHNIGSQSVGFMVSVHMRPLVTREVTAWLPHTNL